MPKAYIRYDGKGRLVGGGPIVQAHKPKNGDWTEIPYESCCTPLPTTTTTTSTSTSTTTSTTSTTTTMVPLPGRASFISAVPIVLRGGTFTSALDMYANNTVANITSTNPTYQTSGLKSQGYQVLRGETYSTTFLETPLSTPQVIVPTYTTTDSGGNPILGTLQDFYEYNKKIINNSFFSTRNPVIRIFRATNPTFFPNLFPNLDGWFLVTIDFDATGAEERGVQVVAKEYQYIYFPTTITYPIPFQLPLTWNTPANYPIQPISYLPSTSTWTVGQTVDGQWLIEEIFTIPGTW